MNDPSAQTPAPDGDTDQETPGAASLPIDFCGGTPPNEGDIIKVKVVDVDADNGSFDVVCVPSEPTKPGIKASAKQFDNAQEAS